MEWLFEGLGTLVIGLILGGTAGSVITWQVFVTKSSRKQVQRAGSNSTQIQSGRDTSLE